MKNQLKSRRGFTLVEIMIVVALIGLLAAITIPSFVKARITSQQKACINNLRQIDGAKQQWALESKQVSSAIPVESDIAPYFGRGAVIVIANFACPADPTALFANSYDPKAVSEAAECKILTLTHKIQ